VRRAGLIALAVVLVAAALYLLVLRDKTVSPTVTVPRPVAAIGVGSGAVGVDSSGRVLATMPAPEDGSLPLLPATEPPKSGRVEGPLLQQVRILAAAPAALRPYLADTSYGEQGVSVELSSGIEVRFGDATEADRKWRAAAAVLADPTTEAVDYIDVQAPQRPAIYGSGHILPPVE
jgi:cell division septal protein FtsQ